MSGKSRKSESARAQGDLATYYLDVMGDMGVNVPFQHLPGNIRQTMNTYGAVTALAYITAESVVEDLRGTPCMSMLVDTCTADYSDKDLLKLIRELSEKLSPEGLTDLQTNGL
jgi:hypothetical protein